MLSLGTQRVEAKARHDGFTLVEMMVVIGIIGVIGAITLPIMSKALSSMRVSGAARSVSNTTSVAKTKAAANFTRARLYVNLAAQSYHVEDWNSTTSQWVVDGGTTFLPANVTFSFGVVTAPPANTQPALAQAPLCTDNMGNNIANTACVMFNSRGIPIDGTFAPTANDAIYLTDGTAVFGVTVAPTGLIGLWSTPPLVAPRWVVS